MRDLLGSDLFTPLAPKSKDVASRPDSTANSNSTLASFQSSSESTSTHDVIRPVADLLRSRSLLPQSQIDSSRKPQISDEDLEDAFFVADMGDVVRQFDLWTRLLPRIEPFFAMKCNPDPMVIKTMVSLGAGFDCASKVRSPSPSSPLHSSPFLPSLS